MKKLTILDDTLVYYIVGDNGASAEGTLNGAYNEMANFNGLASLETPEFLMERYDKLGGPESYNHYAVGWAHAMSTPYQWTKQVASHWGGTRNGTIVHWPNGFKAEGEIRSQFHHVIDVAPTILEAAGLPEPLSVNGVHQRPIEGISMLYSFSDANAAERHETQYFEMFGNRGIYHKGWTAVTKHGTPWVLMGRKTVALDDDVWELYDTSKAWSQSDDMSKQMPEKSRAAMTLADRGDALQCVAYRRPGHREDESGHRGLPCLSRGTPTALRRHGRSSRTCPPSRMSHPSRPDRG
jgi:arylsulfatase